jgi:hypothetical protein
LGKKFGCGFGEPFAERDAQCALVVGERMVVEVNTAPGLPASDPLAHSAPVVSTKYFSGAAMLPKRVGEPSASPAHCSRSASST